MKLIFFMVIMITTLFSKDITNYNGLSKNNTSSEIFYKVCLEGVLYWAYSSKNPEQKEDGKGGVAVYYSKDLKLQKCKITNTKCVDNKPMYGNKKEEICYKEYKEIN